jgi:hypothetical protein
MFNNQTNKEEKRRRITNRSALTTNTISSINQSINQSILTTTTFSQSTVKSVLTATFEQRPLVNNDQPDTQGAQINTSFIGGTSEYRTPLNNSHIFGVPMVVGCTYTGLTVSLFLNQT